MKRLLCALICVFSSADYASRADYVDGYKRQGDAIVVPRFCKPGSGYFYNEWSTYPTVNPYSGKFGTHYRSRTTFVRGAPPPLTPNYEVNGNQFIVTGDKIILWD